MSEKMTAPNYSVGDMLDVLDDQNEWMPARVVRVHEDGTILIHYIFFDSYDTTIDVQLSSARLAPYGTNTFVSKRSVLRVNHSVDVFDIHPASNKWLRAKVIEVWETEVKVHFWNYADKFDEILPRKSQRIMPYGYHSKKTHPDWRPMEGDRHRKKSASSSGEKKQDQFTTSHRGKKFRRTTGELEQYITSLSARNLIIVGAEGDGNCLFRTVSHQMYGTQDYHAMIRGSCVDYMQNEAAFFRNFVTEDYDEYLETMREDGTWGGEPELQAMCEMYNRAAQVYAYDPHDGCHIVREVHHSGVRAESSDPETRKPMRLSFYGGGHYDSLVERGGSNRGLSSEEEPGALERASLETARARLG
jgi:OTU domain-containing protein 5